MVDRKYESSRIHITSSEDEAAEDGYVGAVDEQPTPDLPEDRYEGADRDR